MLSFGREIIPCKEHAMRENAHFSGETKMDAAQLLLNPSRRAQNLRKRASGRTAWNQEPPLSFRKAKASAKLERAKILSLRRSAAKLQPKSKGGGRSLPTDEKCQRIYLGEMTSRSVGLEPFIRWRKGSAISTAEIYYQKCAILRYSTAMCMAFKQNAILPPHGERMR